MVKPIPDGFHTITPHIVCRDAAKALEFYREAFGASEIHRALTPDGKIMHAAMKIGNSMLMVVDEFPEWKCLGPQSIGGTGVTMHMYVEDADALYNRAVKAGAKVTMPINDAFWGDRYGQIQDPFGHSWSIATHTHDYTPEQMGERMKAQMADCG